MADYNYNIVTPPRNLSKGVRFPVNLAPWCYKYFKNLRQYVEKKLILDLIACV